MPRGGVRGGGCPPRVVQGGEHYKTRSGGGWSIIFSNPRPLQSFLIFILFPKSKKKGKKKKYVSSISFRDGF